MRLRMAFHYRMFRDSVKWRKCYVRGWNDAIGNCFEHFWWRFVLSKYYLPRDRFGHAPLNRPTCAIDFHVPKHPFVAMVSQVYRDWKQDLFESKFTMKFAMNVPYLNAWRAAATAIFTSSLPAAWICAVVLPVAGLIVGKISPDLLLYHSLLMNSPVYKMSGLVCGSGVATAAKQLAFVDEIFMHCCTWFALARNSELAARNILMYSHFFPTNWCNSKQKQWDVRLFEKTICCWC